MILSLCLSFSTPLQSGFRWTDWLKLSPTVPSWPKWCCFSTLICLHLSAGVVYKVGNIFLLEILRSPGFQVTTHSWFSMWITVYSFPFFFWFILLLCKCRSLQNLVLGFPLFSALSLLFILSHGLKSYKPAYILSPDLSSSYLKVITWRILSVFLAVRPR